MAAVKVCIVQMVPVKVSGMVAVKVCIVQMVPRNGSC